MLPHWTQNNLMVNGVKLHYTRTGSGNKPPLVLLHGFSDSGLCWLPVARDLEADFDVILPDARGHGLSARVQPGEGIDMAGDLAGFVQGLGLKKPVIGGHSMGAGVSAQAAARFPSLARALILEDPGWWAPKLPEAKEDEPRANPFHDWLMSLESWSVEQCMEKCRADSPTWAEVELRPWAESKKQFDPHFTQAAHFQGMEWPEIVSAIRCPILLITSEPEKGGIVTMEVAKKAASLNRGLRVAQVNGAGHNIRRENYPNYMWVVKSFLKEV